MTDDLEARLRAALSARAEQITADSLRADRLIDEPRRLRAWPGGALGRRLAPLGAAACVLVAVLLVAVVWAKPGGNGAAGAPGTPAVLDGVTFTVPAGWAYQPVVEGVGCVRPTEIDPGGECTPQGVEIRVGDFIGWPANALDRDDGWSSTADGCDEAGTDGSRLTERQTRNVAGQAAAYRVWRVRCGAAPEFTVRLWWLPSAKVTLYTRGLDEADDATVDRLVSSVGLAGRTPGASPTR